MFADEKTASDFLKHIDDIAEQAIMRIRACAAEEQRKQMCASQKHTAPCDFCKDNRLEGFTLRFTGGAVDVLGNQFQRHKTEAYKFCPICGRKL